MKDLYADIHTPLTPYQQALAEKLKASHGVVAFWGTGKGKSLGAINAQEALGEPTDIVTPAALQENYRKELLKHTGRIPKNMRIRSYERAVRDAETDPLRTDGLVIFDEAHRGRNNGTGASELLREARRAKYRLLLTGSAIYNQPSDLAPLINAAAGRGVLPDDPALFKQTFIGTRTDPVPLLTAMKGRILGHPVEPVSQPALINRERLIQATRGYVDVQRGNTQDFPSKHEFDHEIDMSPKQLQMYNYFMGKMPFYLRAKIRNGLPMSKQESQELNAFQGALRQIANTPRGYVQDIDDATELEHTPKIKGVIDNINKARAADPNWRGIVYSNYLDSGIHPLARALTQAGVTHHVFTGGVNDATRAQMVRDYNDGKTPLLLLSGAGSEGLDLKGTKDIHILEPHWNPERIKQVEGRGIRFQSHAHLPEAERRVNVHRYYSTLPKDVFDRAGTLIGQKAPQSIDQYLRDMSAEKARLAEEIAKALGEASAAGPLQRPGAQKQAARQTDEEFMAALVGEMQDAQLGQHARKRVIEYTHPTGTTLRAPYDADYAREQLKEQFDGDMSLMRSQLQDDLLNAGYATIGGLAKKNEQQKKLKQLRGGAWGALAGSLLAVHPRSIEFAGNLSERVRSLPLPRPVRKSLALATFVGLNLAQPLIGQRLGWHIGGLLHKPLTSEDLSATHTHPLLVRPQMVKAKTKLELKER